MVGRKPGRIEGASGFKYVGCVAMLKILMGLIGLAILVELTRFARYIAQFGLIPVGSFQYHTDLGSNDTRVPFTCFKRRLRMEPRRL